MAGFRPLLFVVASLGVVAGVTAIDWTHVTRETRMDGFVQQEQLILGRFKRTTGTASSGIVVSPEVLAKLEAYGVSTFGAKDWTAITTDSATTRYSFSSQGRGDLRQEAKRIAKASPWLAITWRGTRFTSFTAHGRHPSLKGYVSLVFGKLPERKHGADMAHMSAMIQE